jgi:hypothetical protein
MSHYDTQQVCLNGHQITDQYHEAPIFRKEFCDKCGERTIHSCPNCGEEIRGYYHVERVIILIDTTVPEYCPKCGTAFPWTERKAKSLRKLRVFLCHATSDKPLVKRLFQQLRRDNIDPWLDIENLLPGQDWNLEIKRAVRSSDVVIVCLSKSSVNKSGYVQKEIRYALDVADEQPEGTIFLIPLKLEECDIPERLHNWQWVRFFDEDGNQRLMLALQARATSLGMTSLAKSQVHTDNRTKILLLLLREKAALTSAEVSEKLGINHIAVSRILYDLYKNSEVEKEDSERGRLYKYK